ncbi:transposase, partial [Mesorhizobium sp.]|uniref:transposase n=1 Tax=Mesorhizobium sp. TaxID=1871066 RepID=UPI0025C477AF
MNTVTVSYKRHRCPPQIIALAVWLYYRFPLSLRLVEEMLLKHGIVVSYGVVAWIPRRLRVMRRFACGWRRGGHRGGGQPKYSDLAITLCLTLRVVYGLALRQTQGLMRSVAALMRVDIAVPDFSTLSP